jgi:transposase
MRHVLGVGIDCKAATKGLNRIDDQIAAHRARLCELAPEEAHVLSSNIKGLSLTQASVLLIALSDKVFEDRDQLVAFVGLDVRVRQSGKWIGRQVISKRGNGYLRKVLFQIGWSLYMNNDAYHAIYQRMREREKNHKTCILAVARKFLRLLFAFYWKKTVVFAQEQQPSQSLVIPTLCGVSVSLSTV